jgi:hypothetical protein
MRATSPPVSMVFPRFQRVNRSRRLSRLLPKDWPTMLPLVCSGVGGFAVESSRMGL